MQVRFIIFLHVQRYNSLSHPSLHYEVGVQTCLNINWSTRSADSGQIVHFFGDDLQLQIIERISPKASVENLSAQ